MSLAAIDAFFGKMAEDEELQREYSSAIFQATRSAAVEVAAKHGLEFTAQELGEAMENRIAELSDEQLDAVAGGKVAGGRGVRIVKEPRPPVSPSSPNVEGVAWVFQDIVWTYFGGIERQDSWRGD